MPLHLPFSHSKKEDKSHPPSDANAIDEETSPRNHGGCLSGISKSAHHAVDVAVHAVDVAAHSKTKHNDDPPEFWASEGGGSSGDKTKSVQNMGALWASEAGGSKGRGGASI
jgi:hypothetical protein